MANIHAIDNIGNTALHLAVKSSHINIVKILLEHGSNVNKANNYKQLPIHLSTNNDILNLLIKHNSKINEKDYKGDTVMHYFIKKNIKSSIKILLDNYANPFIENNCGLNAIDYCNKVNKNLTNNIINYSNKIKEEYHGMVTNILIKNKQEILLSNQILNFLF